MLAGMTNHVRCDIEYHTPTYVAFWAVYADGDRVYCYSDCIAGPRQPEGYRPSVAGDDRVKLDEALRVGALLSGVA